MTVDLGQAEKIATALLYEGYILWPYRRSAVKNQQRWTFGGVYPREFSEASGGSDPWLMRTECVVVGRSPSVEVSLRFLQVVDRQVLRISAGGSREPVDELRVGSERYLTWDEAAERQITLPASALDELAAPTRRPIAVNAGREEEPIRDSDGTVVGAFMRSWGRLEGQIEVASTPAGDGIYRLRVEITNDAPWDGGTRAEALRRSFISTHTILAVRGGEFVSMTDPPDELKQVAAACSNLKIWPVLVGEEGDRHLLLSSPIITEDYPRIAPESPGDLFDGTEIDQLLLLNVLTLSDEEKAEMRASDPRARAILERTEQMGQQDFMRLNGAIREFQMLRPDAEPLLFETGLERPAPISVAVAGRELRTGCRVRLHPRPGGDIFDLALDGKIAIIEAIEQDYEDRIHVSVSIEDDPGRDLGLESALGHRFFFSVEEVEPLSEGAP